MSNAVVGAMRVNLGLDSAEFAAGLRTASGKLDGFNRAADGFGDKVNAGVNKGAGGLTRFSGSLRGVSMQLSQVAQQATAMGGGIDDWAKAFFTQLPDLALALGPWGILAGAAAGALGTLAINMFSSAEGGRKLDEAVKALSGSFDAYKDAVGAALSPMGDLEKRFGSMAERIAPILRSAAANARLGMVEELEAGVTELTAMLDKNSDVMAGLQPRMFAREFDLVGMFSATTEQAERLGTALRKAMLELRGAQDITAQFDAAVKLRDAYQQIADASGSRSQAERDYLANLDAVILKLAEIKAQDELLAAATEKRADGAAQAIGTVEDAAAAATAAVEAATIDPAVIERAAAAVESLKNDWGAVSAIMKTDMAGVTEPFLAAMDLLIAKAQEAETALPASMTAAVEGMAVAIGPSREQGEAIGAAVIAGAVDGIESRRGELVARARSMADTVSATFRDRLEIHSPSRVFHGFGVNIAEGLARGIGAGAPGAISASNAMAGEVAAAAGTAAASMEGFWGGMGAGMPSAVKDVLKGTQSIGDAIESLARRIGDTFLDKSLDGLWSALGRVFGGGSDPLSAALAGAGVAIPGFANGTRDFAGGLAMVGERGRELVNLPAGSRVMSNPATERLLRGEDRGEIPVRVYVDDSDQLRAMVDRRSGAQVRAESRRRDATFPRRYLDTRRSVAERMDD